MTRVVLKFTEPAEASDRLPDSTFGEYNMLDERNIFSICDTVKLNSFAEFSFCCVWSLLLQRESGLQVLQLFINKLDAEAKHKFFRWENHQRRNFCINALINFLGQCFFFHPGGLLPYMFYMLPCTITVDSNEWVVFRLQLRSMKSWWFESSVLKQGETQTFPYKYQSQCAPILFFLVVFFKHCLQLHRLLMTRVFCCRCMLKTSNHAGVESYVVKNIRNQVEFSMKVRKNGWLKLTNIMLLFIWMYLIFHNSLLAG